MVKPREPNGVEPEHTEDDIQREKFGPRGVPGAPDPAKMTFASVKSKRETVPANYTVQDKTPLRVTVPRGGTKDIHLALEK